MNNIQLKLYVEDALETLKSLSINFIIIIKSIEANQKDKYFIRANFNRTQSSFDESKFVDNILIEYLGVNILSVVDYKQFNIKSEREKNILNYDILKLANRISGKESVLDAKRINISKIKEIHKKISLSKLHEIKGIRDQHWSHIDRKRNDQTERINSDIIEIVKLFLEMFDLILKAVKGISIYEIPPNLQLFDLKLKAFKYDMMIKYLKETQDPDLNSLRTLDLYSNFEDSYKALFKK